MAEINSFQRVIVFLLIMAKCSSSCPEYQKEALLQFKFLLLSNTSFPPDYYLGGLETWNSSASNCCNWDIVICDSSHRVIQIFIQSLTPGIPLRSPVSSDVLSPIFHIQTLTDLDVSSNGFRGPFPAIGISNLTNLVTLYMHHNNFSGTIPPHFSPSKHLEHLSLSFNSIEGILSPNLFRLSNLYALGLEDNFFHGEIPSEIGNLTGLQYLDLANNKLSGPIPSEIGNLTRLQLLNLGNNRLSGPIPSSLFCLRELSNVDLKLNSLSMEIPSEISNLSGIQYLELSGNNLSGTIPPSVHNMTQLLKLDLEDNFLTGEIPNSLFDLRNLMHLLLGGNELFLRNDIIRPKSKLSTLSLRSCNISGEIPPWLSNQTELRIIDLSDSGLIGIFPDWFIRINPNLFSLFLSDNKLSGQIFPVLFNSSCIQNLDLSRNHFSGFLPDNITGYSCLNILMLSSNDFTGPIPKSLSTGPLWTLDLSNNRFSGSEFPSLSSLYTLDLSFNEFSGEIPTNFSDNLIVLVISENRFSVYPQKLASLTNLKCLDLHDNNLTGEIPSFLSQISSLQILNLRDNSFEGPIPINLSNLTLLQILDLSYNKLSGKIPASVGKLSGMIGIPQDLFYSVSASYGRGFTDVHIKYPDLEVIWKAVKRNLPNQHLGMYTLLDLSSNQLSGEIPVTFGALKNLKLLNISHNSLSGIIQSTMGGLENLESLDMSYNRLSGEIPETLGKLLQLSDLELRNNNLSGRIPTGPQMDRLNDPESYANNNGVCGMQIQVSCSKEPPIGKADEESNEEKWWFSWMMAAIGFPSGFISTVSVLYIIGFFICPPNRRRRYYKPGR